MKSFQLSESVIENACRALRASCIGCIGQPLRKPRICCALADASSKKQGLLKSVTLQCSVVWMTRPIVKSSIEHQAQTRLCVALSGQLHIMGVVSAVASGFK